MKFTSYDELVKAMIRVYEAHGDYFTDAPECKGQVAALEDAILALGDLIAAAA